MATAYIDETENAQLARSAYSEPTMREELARIDELISRLVTTGADLSYFNERERILRELLREQV